MPVRRGGWPKTLDAKDAEDAEEFRMENSLRPPRPLRQNLGETMLTRRATHCLSLVLVAALGLPQQLWQDRLRRAVSASRQTAPLPLSAVRGQQEARDESGRDEGRVAARHRGQRARHGGVGGNVRTVAELKKASTQRTLRTQRCF